MNLLNEVLADKASTMRFCLLFTVIVVISTWAGISAYKGAVLDLPVAVVGVIGIMVTGKVVQRYKESSKV